MARSGWHSQSRVSLLRVGEVPVFVVGYGQEVRKFMNNSRQFSEAAMVQLYEQRWWIEALHRELKQRVEFGALLSAMAGKGVITTERPVMNNWNTVERCDPAFWLAWVVVTPLYSGE
jgi:hypothetical protein